MSTSVKGFRPADDKWRKMKEIYDHCEEFEIDIPKEVEQFFGGDRPGDGAPGMEVSIDSAVSELERDNSEGYSVEIAKLPPDVKFIWFYNSW